MYKTYVMHYKPATDRYDFISKQLEENNIANYEFVTDYDKEELTEEVINKYYDRDDEYQAIASSCSTRGAGPIEYRKLAPSEISLCVKYMKTFEKILKSDDDYILFLEDDCNFKIKNPPIEKIIEKAPEEWDAIFIGGAFGINIVKVLDLLPGYAAVDHPATNTTSSMILTKRAVKRIREYASPFCLPIDWQLNYAFEQAELNVYHTVPYFCNQLSGTQFNSNVER